MSDEIGTLFYSALCWFLLAAFEIRILEVFWKINLDKTVGILDK
jgi:hypothetical protein